MPTPENQNTRHTPRFGWRWLPWIVASGCLLAIVSIRMTAHTSDFAMANVLTTLLTFLAWLSLSLACATSSLPRFIWKILFFSPLAGSVLFLGLFKFERVDGDLTPHFQSRWTTNSRLPALNQAQTEGQANLGIAAELVAPRASDYPQYLGPQRDASLTSVAIESNWNTTPPRIAWKQEIGDGWSGFAIQGDVALTMEQRQAEEWVSAYSVIDGSLLWKYVIPGKHTNVMGGTGPRSTPTIAGDRVYACSAVSRVVCIELASGTEVWSRELLELANANQSEFEALVSWGRSASPLIIDNQLIVPLGGVDDSQATLIALDKNTGDEIWRSGKDQISYSSPALNVLSEVPQILLISEKKLAGYAIADGSQLWSADWPGNSNGSASVSQPIVVDATHILITKGYGEGAKFLQVELVEGEWKVETLWANSRVLRTKFTNCVVKDGYAYGLSDGILECVSLSDGKRQWKNGRYRQGQVLLVGEHLLITSEAGEIVLVQVDPRNFDEVARFPVIGDVTWNTAALSGNRLLMRNSDEAACVILPLKME